MQKEINIGDLVLSIAGRDRNVIFLVTDVQGKFAYVVDGKVHKVYSPKKKNIKHLERLNVTPLVGVIEKLHANKIVGNLSLRKEINNSVNKK
ncbi:MAG: RNA-binding protein [Clostridia bacterium]|nr:RNA-binding protein [Clostridia bacterium]